MTKAEARILASLGYALDRTTPARRMKNLDINKVHFDDTGKVKSADPDFWTGGETGKKYPLIVTNIKTYEELTISNIYELTVGNLLKEADAADKSFEAAQNGLLLEDERAQLEILRKAIKEQASLEIMATQHIQNRVLAFIHDSLQRQGFSGHLKKLDQDIALLKQVMETISLPESDRATAGYLLGTLIGIRTNPTAMNHFGRIEGEYQLRLKLLSALGEHLARGGDVDQEQVEVVLRVLSFLEQHLVSNLQIEEKAANSLLIEKGKTDQDVFILLDGALTIDSPRGQLTVLPGELVGEMAITTGVRNADVRVPVGGFARVARISDQYLNVLLKDPEFLASYTTRHQKDSTFIRCSKKFGRRSDFGNQSCPKFGAVA